MVIKKDVQNQNDINVYIMNAINSTSEELNYRLDQTNTKLSTASNNLNTDLLTASDNLNQRIDQTNTDLLTASNNLNQRIDQTNTDLLTASNNLNINKLNVSDASITNMPNTVVKRTINGQILDPDISGQMKVGKILENINYITMTSNTYELSYNNNVCHTTYCVNSVNNDLTLNITNLVVNDSKTITMSFLIDTNVAKRYFKNIQIDGTPQTVLNFNGLSNFVLPANTKLALQQLTLIFVNGTLSNIINSISSLW
jgi:hypothetical protein